MTPAPGYENDQRATAWAQWEYQRQLDQWAQERAAELGYQAQPEAPYPGDPGQREPLAAGQLSAVQTFFADNWPLVFGGLGLAFLIVQSGIFQRDG